MAITIFGNQGNFSNATDLYNSTDATKGVGLIKFNYALNYAQGTLGAWMHNVGIDVTQEPFNCDPTGVNDCSDVVNTILNTYPGVPLHFPCLGGVATYRFDSTLTINPPPSWGVFGPGTRIFGDGIGNTVFDNRVANGPLFDVDSDSHGGAYHANMGTCFYGFRIITTTSPANSIGIRVLNGYQMTFEQVGVVGMSLYGIELKNGAYADDGWNRVFFKNCWIEGCGVWGIKADGGANRNEGSYTYLEGVFFQSNGTAGTATPPTSGGMIWKGQVLVLESGGGANGNQQCVLYLKGDTGLGNVVDVRNWTAENTYGWGIYCDGVDLFKGRNIQLYNNTVFTCDTMLEFAGPTYSVKEVDIDGVVVRNAGLNMTGSVTGTLLNITSINGIAEQKIVVGSKIYGAGVTAGSYVVSLGTGSGGIGTYTLSASSAATGSITITGRPTTAFKISGTNAEVNTCSIMNVAWENFDFPGQTRFDGWQFPHIQNCCELVADTTTTLLLRPVQALGRGCTVPYRLRGYRGGVPSTTGEWVARQIPNGISATNGGLAINTRYYVYLYDNNGIPSLDISTTAYTLDTATGYTIKTGDATRLYVGSVKTAAGTTQFLTAGVGWLNPMILPGSQTGVYSYLWSDASNRLMIRYAVLPTSDTDGTIVGTQV